MIPLKIFDEDTGNYKALLYISPERFCVLKFNDSFLLEMLSLGGT